MQWRYIPSEENPADVASRGYSPQNVPADLQFGRKWLQDQNSWPSDNAAEPRKKLNQKQKLLRKSY